MRKIKKILIALLVVLLTASIVLNVYWMLISTRSYLQSPEEIYIMEAGILRNNLTLRQESDAELAYDFDHDDYPLLIETYKLDKIAGEGSELERALRLMDEFAPRLHHNSYYDNHIPMNALTLLEYSLDNKSQGINCRAKAQILNEMCLTLGIYARKVWIMPNSGYDNDCHVVNEIWDSTLGKWVMLDITNNQYWVDGNGTPLSVLEIREKGAMQEFCTPVTVGESLKNLERSRQKHMADFLYIMKNMTYMQYCDTYTVGETETIYLLFPENLDTTYDLFISENAVKQSPIS